MDRLPSQPESECWLHPDVVIGPSSIAQLGLFASAAITPTTVVARIGGRLVTSMELQQIFSEAADLPEHPYVDTITVGEDLHLVLAPGQRNHYGNHSCDPNLSWADAYTLVARRLIMAGDEVTSDYATSSGIADFAMACSCGSPLCRGVITGEDWRRPELRARYGNYWVPVLLDRIRRGLSRKVIQLRRRQDYGLSAAGVSYVQRRQGRCLVSCFQAGARRLPLDLRHRRVTEHRR